MRGTAGYFGEEKNETRGIRTKKRQISHRLLEVEEKGNK
jgi:hypothetical protein